MAQSDSRDPLNAPSPSSPSQSPKPEQRPWLSGRLSPRTLFGWTRSSSAPPPSAPVPEEFNNPQFSSPDASPYGHGLEPPPLTQFKQLGSPSSVYTAGQTLEPPSVAQYRQPTSPPMDVRYGPIEAPPGISPEHPHGYVPYNPGSYPPPSISRFAQPTSPPMPRGGYEPFPAPAPTTSAQYQPGAYGQYPNSVPQQSGSTSLPQAGNSRSEPLSSENPTGPPQPLPGAMSLQHRKPLPTFVYSPSVDSPSDEPTGSRIADGDGSVNIQGDQSPRESKDKKRQSIVAGPSTRNETSGDSFNTDKRSPSASAFVLPEIFVNASDQDPPVEPNNNSNDKPGDILRTDEVADETDEENAPNATPVTPKQKRRPKAVATSPSNDMPATMDPLAPPISRNPLASPLNKPEGMFTSFRAPSPLLPSSESVSSPLLPPTTPSLVERPSSEEVKSKPRKPTVHYDTSKPTCTLNLVCYRSGSKGCELHQIQTAKRSRFKSDADFQRMVDETPGLVVTDEQFFRALRTVYLDKMCGFWRRVFFLKTLRGIRLLSVSAVPRITNFFLF